MEIMTLTFGRLKRMARRNRGPTARNHYTQKIPGLLRCTYLMYLVGLAKKEDLSSLWIGGVRYMTPR